jgi:hypothetical protein
MLLFLLCQSPGAIILNWAKVKVDLNHTTSPRQQADDWLVCHKPQRPYVVITVEVSLADFFLWKVMKT